jgi:hypothetical protein
MSNQYLVIFNKLKSKSYDNIFISSELLVVYRVAARRDFSISAVCAGRTNTAF